MNRHGRILWVMHTLHTLPIECLMNASINSSFEVVVNNPSSQESVSHLTFCSGWDSLQQMVLHVQTETVGQFCTSLTAVERTSARWHIVVKVCVWRFSCNLWFEWRKGVSAYMCEEADMHICGGGEGIWPGKHSTQNLFDCQQNVSTGLHIEKQRYDW
jgi:hypothetical protein